jgi:hypothetical protein
MKTPLKAGDRVRLRGSKVKGVITGDTATGLHVCVVWDDDDHGTYDPELLIKLKKRRPLIECWVNVYPGERFVCYPTKEKADCYAVLSARIRCVRLVEKREK